VARLSTKKLQDLDISTPRCLVQVEVFYRKRGNTIGDFFFESLTVEHTDYGLILIPGASFKSLMELQVYVEGRVARHAPVPSALKFTKYARKQAISDGQLDRCVTSHYMEESPLYRNWMLVAEDKEGRIWCKFDESAKPRLVTREEYEIYIGEFVLWDEKKVDELNELVKTSAQELVKLRQDWTTKYKTLIRQKHDECTGVRVETVSVKTEEATTLQEIIQTYS
jgi:hypothetical protein